MTLPKACSVRWFVTLLLCVQNLPAAEENAAATLVRDTRDVRWSGDEVAR